MSDACGQEGIVLREFCFARAGDKGDISNVLVCPYDEADYPWLVEQLTVERVARHFGDLVAGPITIYEMPGLRLLNVVMERALQGGVSRSLGLDQHGKSRASLMLSLAINASTRPPSMRESKKGALLPEAALAPGDPVLAAAAARTGRQPGQLYRTLAHSPSLLSAWTEFAARLRESPVSPRALRELLILRTAQLTSCAYEWAEHRDMAVAAGVTEEQILALHDWSASALFDDATRLALSVAEAVVRGAALPPELADEVRRRLSPGVTVELILTASFYCMASRVLNGLEISVVADRAERLSGFVRPVPVEGAAVAGEEP
jgi:AhpD family alkylhydroperoxidase